MWLCEGSKIDWTAVAACIALAIWLFDKYQRSGERAASARLLAQIMTSNIATTQGELAKFRTTVVPPNGDQSFLMDVRETQDARKTLASKALLIPIDLPSQFLDKADFFSESLSKTLANAFFQINHLKNFSKLLSDTPDSSSEEEIDARLMAVLSQIQEAEKAIGEAFMVLRQAGTATA
ncbi:hypothetical protein HX780_02200 [Pseudomonas tolaasii]|uniref:hypothetical protein n=1 Tax=Pseudomonas tolaasii TaxID=29442 RepID=UPI0015A27D9A|nr:hypothetical protein [Pseudomonas tolaasii]NVZ44243.1 hypothetical protein [Pseudomonas tolaasii]NWA47104.1 hypothetical protein [Pseudomonas tolaasii]